MASIPDSLRRSEVLSALPTPVVEEIASLGSTATYPAGHILWKAGDRLSDIYVIQTGILAMYVPTRQAEYMALDILGPRRVLPYVAFLPRPDPAHFEVRILMDSNFLVLPGRGVSALMSSKPSLAQLVFEELYYISRRQINNLLRVLTAEEVTFPTEQACPSGRATRFLAQVNTLTGEAKGMCQRRFSCSVAEGGGCPMAGLPALEFHPISNGNHHLG